MSQQTNARRPAASHENRMTLGTIKSSLRVMPDRILLVGVEGIGKTTFGACAPSPIFLPTEDGVSHLDVQAFPIPKSYEDALGAVDTLTTNDHGFKTLVIDTLDALEPLIAAAVCKRNQWESPETPGYGKGWVAVTAEWRTFLLALDRLRAAKGMEIILLAHSTLRTVTNPSGPDYSRYEGKLNKGALALVKEWTDVNLFAIHEETVSKIKGEMKSKVTTSGRRVIHTERGAAWDAKNRHNLPPTLALDYSEYAAARDANRVASPEALEAEANALVAEWAPTPEEAAKFQPVFQAAKGDARALARVVDRLKTKVAEKAPKESA